MRRRLAAGTAVAIALAVLLARARGACAQDFASPAPAAEFGTPAALLERALPGARQRASLELLAIAWDPAAELSTRALAALTAWRGLEWSAGWSSTGDGELGWNAAAIAIGQASDSHGAGVRALVRRDRAPSPGYGTRAIGAEAGAGFWSAIGSHGRIWASAPMAFETGEAPPLDRGLETGMSVRVREYSAWGLWSAPAGAVDAAERTLGVTCEAGLLALWAEARDRPLRGSIGVRARRGALTVLARVDEHPLLGETARLSLGFSRAAP
ncbi:MAG: hypothetical protein ACRENS_02415 [Candidatus Eiseniibacteriota bacterium]